MYRSLQALESGRQGGLWKEWAVCSRRCWCQRQHPCEKSPLAGKGIHSCYSTLSCDQAQEIVIATLFKAVSSFELNQLDCIHEIHPPPPPPPPPLFCCSWALFTLYPQRSSRFLWRAWAEFWFLNSFWLWSSVNAYRKTLTIVNSMQSAYPNDEEQSPLLPFRLHHSRQIIKVPSSRVGAEKSASLVMEKSSRWEGTGADSAFASIGVFWPLCARLLLFLSCRNGRDQKVSVTLCRYCSILEPVADRYSLWGSFQNFLIKVPCWVLMCCDHTSESCPELSQLFAHGGYPCLFLLVTLSINGPGLMTLHLVWPTIA